jgi:AraC family transcriptional regulator
MSATDIGPLLLEIQQTLDGDLNLEKLATKYGYSPFHFHRFFSDALGETPKKYVERLRMEKAAYKLWITSENVLDIALAVGFKNHETFTRAFKRFFGTSPRQFREDGRTNKRKVVENHRWQSDSCVLSQVRFERLRPMTLLATRHVGAYTDIPKAFSESDRLWTKIAAWADSHGIRYQPIALSIFYDNPWLTPKNAQRADACFPIQSGVKGTRTIRCIPFEGGLHGVIEHMGPDTTRPQAFRKLADTVHASAHYKFPAEPAAAIMMKPLGHNAVDRSEVWIPVVKRSAEHGS